jgi:cytochrome c biogenesis protein CcmG/thiol:disulfide interchange protein DsbE
MAGKARIALQAGALALVVALLGLLVWKVATPDTRPVEGPAPSIDGNRLDGPGKLALRDFRGRGVVINFWASWCEPCKEEAAALEQAYARYRGDGLVVLGVGSQDFRSALERFARRYKVTYPLLHDTSDEARSRYGVNGFPETFFVDRAGRLVGESIQGPVNRDANAKRFADGIRLALR